MKRSFVCCLAAIICLFAGCNPDKDPWPDLNGTISFKWLAADPATTAYYVVISDSLGNVLQWKKLDNTTATSIPYPSDPAVAMVTLIESIANATGGHQTNMTTFTGIASDDYYNEINQYIPIPVVGSSELKVTIPNRVNYNIATVYVKGPVDLKSYNDGETLDLNYGLTGDNDLFVLLEKITLASTGIFTRPMCSRGKSLLHRKISKRYRKSTRTHSYIPTMPPGWIILTVS